MNRRSFLAAVSRLGAALAASPLAALLPDRLKPSAYDFDDFIYPYPHWRAYTDRYTYTSLSKDEIMLKWRAAYDKMEWEPPLCFPDRIIGLEVDEAGELMIHTMAGSFGQTPTRSQ